VGKNEDQTIFFDMINKETKPIRIELRSFKRGMRREANFRRDLDGETQVRALTGVGCPTDLPARHRRFGHGRPK
jgi:hypothetical protein